MTEASMMDKTLYERPGEILQRLIRFDTTNPPGQEGECVAYIADLLAEAGLETTLLARHGDRPNLVARLKGEGKAPPLLLHGHVDVVTTAHQRWTYPPFEGREAKGYIWGRGALDMKGGVAMMVAAVLRARAEGLVPAGDVVLAILADEEAGGDFGAGYLVRDHGELFQGIRYALGEFGGFSAYVAGHCFYPIQVTEKQFCQMRLTLRGPGGHGSLPLRDGAMAQLGVVLERLNRHSLPVHIDPTVRRMVLTMASRVGFPKGIILGQLLNPLMTDRILGLLGEQGRPFRPLLHNTVNATMVRGGEKINVIPSEVILEMDARLLPGFQPDTLIGELRQAIGPVGELEVVRFDRYPSQPDLGWFDGLAGILRDLDPKGTAMPMVLPGFTDARHFAHLGIQTYGFLPMKLPPDFNFTRTIHAADERIPVEALAFGARALFMAIQRYH